MAITLIDPKETLKFIPSSEEGEESPTTFHLSQSDVRDSFKRNKLFNINRTNGENSIEFADDEVWFDYLAGRIVKIENVHFFDLTNNTQLQTLETSENIADALSRMPASVGSELFAFVMQNSSLAEDEVKN